MFGYLKTQKNLLEKGEIGLFQTFTCGVCLAAEADGAQKAARGFIGYDINFFNVLFHSFCGENLQLCTARCPSSPIKKRTVGGVNDINTFLSRANTILAYYKLCDDVTDDNSLVAKVLRARIHNSYTSARENLLKFDQAVCQNYDALRNAEKQGGQNLDAVCHHFAQMSRKLAEEFLEKFSPAEKNSQRGQFLLTLCYNIGKWIYLIDALDDLKRDMRKKKYNALYVCMGVGEKSAREFLQNNAETLQFLFYSVLNTCAQCYNDLNLTMYVCLLNNVIYKSIRNQTDELLTGGINAPKTNEVNKNDVV